MYRDVTRAAIRQKHDLDIFLLDFERPPKDSIEDLPSWVPPWYSTIIITFKIVNFNAGKGFPQHFCDRHVDPSILTLASFVLGEVKAYCQLGELFDRSKTAHLIAQDSEVYFSTAEALTRQWSPSDESMHHRLGRTLIGGYTIDGNTAKRANADSIASFTAGNWRVPGQQAHSLKESPSRNEPSSIPRSFALALMLNSKRRFFVTDSGHISLGPRVLEEGMSLPCLGVADVRLYSARQKNEVAGSTLWPAPHWNHGRRGSSRAHGAGKRDRNDAFDMMERINFDDGRVAWILCTRLQMCNCQSSSSAIFPLHLNQPPPLIALFQPHHPPLIPSLHFRHLRNTPHLPLQIRLQRMQNRHARALPWLMSPQRTRPMRQHSSDQKPNTKQRKTRVRRNPRPTNVYESYLRPDGALNADRRIQEVLL